MEASFCGCDQRRERGNDAESGNAPASDEPGSNSSSVHNGGTPAPAPSADGIVYSGGFHFSSNHLQQIGYRFCRALHVYFGLGAPPNSESKLEEPPGMPSISSIEGIQNLPDNASVHAAIIELMQGDVDAGPDADSEGSDGGDASDSEPSEGGTPAATTAGAKSTPSSTTNVDSSKGRVAAPPQPQPKVAKAPAEEPVRRRNSSIMTRRTREAEMRAAAQRAEAAAAAAAALLGNRPDLLSGPSLPPPRPAVPAPHRPEHSVAPPPLIQQPSVLLEQQRHNAQLHMQQQPLQQQLAQQHLVQQRTAPPPFQQQPSVLSQFQQQPSVVSQFQQQPSVQSQFQQQPSVPTHFQQQPSVPSQFQQQPSVQSQAQQLQQSHLLQHEQPPPAHPSQLHHPAVAGLAPASTSTGGLDAEDDGEFSADGEMGPDGAMTRGASFERGRGFSGKSLSMRSNQWAARPRPAVPSGPGGAILQARAGQGLVPNAPPTEGRPRQLLGAPQPPLGQGPPLAPATASPGGSTSKTHALLKRRPYLHGTLGGENGDDSSVGVGGAHATPFAELIARRGGDAAAAHGSSSALANVPHGDGPSASNGDGLVAGLELLVSHVRRPNGGASAGGEGPFEGGDDGGADLMQRGGGFGNGRSKSSPVAGRRALPPSAVLASQQQQQVRDSDMSEPGGGDRGHSAGAADGNDAIYGLSANVRSGARRATDDAELVMSAAGSTTLLPAGSGMAGAAACSNAPPHAAVQHGTNQVLSAAARQRWSARENDRGAPCHNPLPFGKDAGVGGPPSAAMGSSLNNNGSWPRTWHSCAHGGAAGQGGSWVGGSSNAAGGLNSGAGSRPRSVEGAARPSDARAGLQQQARRTAYYSQPGADPRLALQPSYGSQQY